MPVYADPTGGARIPVRVLQDWTAALLEVIGTPADIAADVATVLLASDRRGIASHGTARLQNYVALVESGVLDPTARPSVDVDRPALSLIDAHNGWGHHAGRVAVDRAIDKAREQGSALVVVRNTNHYGIAGWYALRIAEAGMIGMSLTNSSPLVAPTRSKAPLLGTNPIAIAAPAGEFGTFCLDMATSTIPRGRIEVAARRGEAIPDGLAIDRDGYPTSDPDAALEGSLLPLGGREETGGYKGYGLSLVVDILTGVLGGATFGPHIVGLFSGEKPSDLGQTFWAIDPDALGPPGAFVERLGGFLEELTHAELAPGAPGRVLVHGEPEAEAERRAAERGVVIDQRHHGSLVELGARLDVPFPEGAA